MAITSRPPDIEAEITLLATEFGGRHSAAKSGYRPSHDFGLDSLNDAVHEYIGKESVLPGQSAKANLWLLVPKYQNGRLYPGFKFTVQEGPRIVGHGVVLTVINPILEKRI